MLPLLQTLARLWCKVVKFQCLRSGNSVSFSDENDINSMRKHEGYKEIKDGLQEEIKAPTEEVTLVVKRGRPKKAK